MIARLAVSIYAMALRAFPPAHRERYGAETIDSFKREFTLQNARGRLRALQFAFVACLDALTTGVGERRRRRSTEPSPVFRDLLADVRYGIRALLRAPLFTGVAVLTLALGVGATTAIFTVVYGVLIKPLPFHGSDALVSIKHASSDMNAGPPAGMTLSLLVSYARENRAFEHVGVWARGTGQVAEDILPEGVNTLSVSAGVLRALGVQPALGRWFTDTDQGTDAIDTVILMDGYWARRFGRDPLIIGRRISVDSRQRVVVGVMPASFRFLDEAPDLVLPVRIDPATLTLGGFNFEGVARLASGVTAEQATSDLARMLPGWREAWPPYPGFDRSAFAQIRPLVQPLQQQLIGNVGNMLWILMGTIGIVLLIACANVSNLVLVRAQERRSEFALRTALGASRGRLARQVAVEHLVLGLLGGAAGLAVAAAGLPILSSIGASIPRLREITIDPVVFLFVLGLSLLCALIFGSLHVARFADHGLASTLRSGGRSASDSRERNRARHVLAIVQVALALILLVGSGLMVRTFLALRNVPPGFVDPGHVQLVRVNVSEAQMSEPERVLQLQRSMLDRLAAVPGVTSASFTGNVPMANERSRSAIFHDDVPMADQVEPPMRWFRYIAPGYFRTIGARIVTGRDFSWDDLAERRPVAVVSENLARELWREPQAALGKRIREGATSQWRDVIGVVADVYDDGVHRAAPAIVYWPSFMENFSGQPLNVRRSVTFALRTNRAGSADLLNEVRAAMSSIRADVALTNVRTLGDVYENSMASTSFALVMLVIAAAIALVLGTIGIYGVIAYSVTQRRREIGIRLALGATRGEVSAMFVRSGMTLAFTGVACGLVGAVVLSHLMASLLFKTSAFDPILYLLVSAALAAIVTVATYVPARRATNIDPIRTLSGE